MSEIFGHRWVSSYGAMPSDSWARGLVGLTGDQLANGLAACANGNDEWPPTLPKFRALCTTNTNMPSADEAWVEALQIARRWKRPHECANPAIYHALSQVLNYTMIDEVVLRERFIRNYEQTLRLLADGGELLPIPQPLPRPEDVRTNYPPEVRAKAAADAMAKLDELMGRRAQA